MCDIQVRIYQPCQQCSAITDRRGLCNRCDRIAQQAARILALEAQIGHLTAAVDGYFVNAHVSPTDVIRAAFEAKQVLRGKGVGGDTGKGDTRKDGDHAA